MRFSFGVSFSKTIQCFVFLVLSVYSQVGFALSDLPHWFTQTEEPEVHFLNDNFPNRYAVPDYPVTVKWSVSTNHAVSTTLKITERYNENAIILDEINVSRLDQHTTTFKHIEDSNNLYKYILTITNKAPWWGGVPKKVTKTHIVGIETDMDGDGWSDRDEWYKCETDAEDPNDIPGDIDNDNICDGFDKPYISTLSNTITYEGETFNAEIHAIDRDEEPLTYEVLNAPEGAELNGKYLTWDVPHDYVDSEDVYGKISHKITLIVKDNSHTSIKEVYIQIRNRLKTAEIIDNIYDKNFKSCLEEIFKRENYIFINEVKEINCADKNIEYIGDLRYFTSLETLNISNNPKIQELPLHYSIKNLGKLHSIYASNTSIRRIDTSNLKNLDISNTPIEYLLFEEYESYQLTSLKINNTNNLKNVYFKRIRNNLKIFEANNSELETLELANMPNIETLNLSNTNINNLDFSSNINIKNLDVSNNKNIKDIDLINHKFIENLNISNTSISNLNIDNGKLLSLINANNTNIDSLNISHVDAIKSISINNTPFLNNIALGNTNNLKNIDISDSNISSLNLLSVPNLKKLIANNTKISNILLSNTDNLEYLYIHDNQNLNRLDLGTLNNLIEINISNTSIDNLDLSQSINLEQVQSRGSSVSEIDLRDSPKIEFINVSNNSNLLNLYLGDTENLTELIANKTGITNDLRLENALNLKTLQLSNSNVRSLNLSNSPELSTLDITNIPNLRQLEIASINSKDIDLTGNSNLESINILDTDISYLITSGLYNLKDIRANNTLLKEIDLSNLSKLESVNFENNPELNEIKLLNNPNLSDLIVSNTLIDSLEIDKNMPIERLHAQNTKLTSLDLSDHEILEDIKISDNSNLNYLNLSDTNVSEVNLDGVGQLEEFLSNNTKLKKLNVSGAPNLLILEINNNLLTDIDLSNNLNLTKIDLSYNKQISNIDTFNSNKIESINIKDTSIKNLNSLPLEYIQYLNANNTDIKQLDLSRSSFIRELYLRNTDISELLINQSTTIESIDISNTPITKLNIFHRENLKKFHANNTKLSSINLSYSNNLEEINVNNNLNLKTLNVSHSKIKNLDLEKAYKLENIYANNTLASTINIPDSKDIISLTANNNQNLKDINYQPLESLLNIDISYTDISDIDISKSINLEAVNISNTRISEFYFLNHHNLKVANISNTNISKANLSNSSQMIHINAHSSKIKDIEGINSILDSAVSIILNNNPLSSNSKRYLHQKIKEGYANIKFDDAVDITSFPEVLKIGIGHIFEYRIEATGGTYLEYAFTSKPPSGLVIENNKITWRPTEYQTGLHDINIVASNAISEDRQSFTIDVSPSYGSSSELQCSAEQ